MAPTPVSNPDRRFVLTRLDGSTETNVTISTLLSANYSTDAAVRSAMYDTTRTTRDANPGVVYLLYGPSNGGAHTNGDRIWDSRLNGGQL